MVHVVHRWWRFAIAAAAAALVLAVPAGAEAAGPFTEFAGSWSGSGHIRLDAGRSETLRCKAYYSPRAGGAAMGLALRCASASNKIDLRANLSSNGNRVAGSWEERSYNASGRVYGRASGGNIRLSIEGSALSGSLSVTTSGRTQSISVATNGATVRGIQLNMRRDGG